MNDYTGDKVKNYFTAYLREFIRSKRWSYLKKMENSNEMEKTLKNSIQTVYEISIEELLEARQREEMLFREQKGIYPEWNELSDQELIHALMLLSETERRIIYQRVFVERTFEEIGRLNGLTDKKAKWIYYYAIRKIRKQMGGGC